MLGTDGVREMIGLVKSGTGCKRRKGSRREDCDALNRQVQSYIRDTPVPSNKTNNFIRITEFVTDDVLPVDYL